MRRRQAAPPAHAYPTYPEERKPVPTTPYVPQATTGRMGGGGGNSYLPNHPSSGGTGGAQHYSGGDVGRKTFAQTATLHGKWALRGLQDACKIRKCWDLIANDARLRGNLIKSLLINIPFLLSLLFLSFVILPILSKAPSTRSENPSFLSWILRSPQLWQFLGTGGVVLVNGVWQGKIAERAWGLNSGGGGGGGGAMGVNGGAAGGGSLSTRTLLLLDYILLTSLFRLVPYLGWLPAFLYTLLVNSYYCFEYTQSAQGYTLPERILFLQTRSSYFAGFALPLTLLTTNPFLPPLLSTTIFALLYPLYLILASSSTPLPSAGSSSAFSSLPVDGSGGGGEEGGFGGGEEGEGGGHEGDWWEWWPRKVRVLEGGLWAVGVWEGMMSGLQVGTGGRGGHRRKGSRI